MDKIGKFGGLAKLIDGDDKYNLFYSNDVYQLFV